MKKQTTIKGLPVYVAGIDEDCGMTCVSLVDMPAVERDFLAFDAQKVTQTYAVEDEEKRLIFGVIMRANFPIYRKDKQLGEYFIIYKPDTLRAMAEKYLAEGRANSVDLMHDGKTVEGVQMEQFFIKDTANGIAPVGFEEVEDGSLFGEFHVVNDEIWQGVKDGTFRGFSIETLNTIAPETAVVSEEKIAPALLAALKKVFNSSNMNERLQKAFAAFLTAIGETREQMQFGAVTTDKGVIHWEGDEDLREGDAVYSENEDGERVAIEDGDYTTEDGKVIRVAGGKVAAIVDDRAEVSEEGDQETEAAEETPVETGETERRLAEAEERIARLEDAVARLLEDNVNLRKEQEEMKKQPAAAPAHEEFNNNEPPKTGNERYDRLREFGRALSK